jgi:hypothetical protein
LHLTGRTRRSINKNHQTITQNASIDNLTLKNTRMDNCKQKNKKIAYVDTRL